MQEQILELFDNRSVKLTLLKIAEDTGLPKGWLSMLGRRKIKEPSEARLKILYDYLISKVDKAA